MDGTVEEPPEGLDFGRGRLAPEEHTASHRGHVFFVTLPMPSNLNFVNTDCKCTIYKLTSCGLETAKLHLIQTN